MGLFADILKPLIQKKKKAKKSSVFGGRSNNKKEKIKEKQQQQQMEKNSAAVITNPSSGSGKNFKYNEDGRTYHSNPDVKYVFPNDDDEKDRLHEQHWILKNALQTNYHAPVTELLKKGITVLDAACGPATWTFDMAQDFPETKFIGVDISFVFPELIRPANVDLVIGNITQTLPFPDNTFDYIHQRLVIAAFTNENWEAALKELYRILKPDGYIEIVEPDIHSYINAGPLFDHLQSTSNNMLYSRGFPKGLCSQLQDRLVKAGFVNQVQNIILLPFGHNSKIGHLLWKDVQHACRNARPLLAKSCPEWEDSQKFEQHLDLCTKELQVYKTDMNYYTLYAQKPLN